MGDFEGKLKSIEWSLGFDDILIKPNRSSVSLSKVDLSLKLTDKITLKVPVFAAAMDTITSYEMARAMIERGACAPLHRNNTIEKNIEIVKKLSEEFGDTAPIAVAIGVNNTKEDIKNYVDAGANVILVDCSHAHTDNVGDLVKLVATEFPDVFLIAGNVVTKEGSEYLIEQGAKAIKVGLGGGSICTTRKVTGLGVGQVTAVAEVANFNNRRGIMTIADGGIRGTDEIMKAIACGADAVMLGYMVAGCDECPGDITEIEGQKYKYYRGMGSLKAMQNSGSKDRYNKSTVPSGKLVGEGVESYVKAKGSVKGVLDVIEWSLRSAFGYVGAYNIKEVQEKTELVRVTNSVQRKSSFHSIDKLLED